MLTQTCTRQGLKPTAGLPQWTRPHASGSRCKPVCRAAAVSAVQLQTLQQAGRTRSVPTEQVEAALLALEAASKAGSAQGSLDTVPGNWRLVYSTGSSIKAFHYIPIKEDLKIDLTKKHISLESELGPFQFLVKGTVFGWDPASGVLDFQFDRGVSILLGERQVWEVKPTTKRKTYTFFYADGSVAGARSSAGGLSLLVR